jgi:hypothetical protein
MKMADFWTVAPQAVALMMEAASTFDFYRTKQPDSPEGSQLHTCRHDKLKFTEDT